MSALSSLLHWALGQAQDAGKQALLQAMQSGAAQLTGAIKKGAPDVADVAVAKINEGISHAVAGLLTRTGGSK